MCRTASTILITACGVPFPVGAVAPQPGQARAVTPAWMTAAPYGPISLLAVWEAQEQHPIYLVTNLSDRDAAIAHYRKRAHSETFFSDQKSRGFQLHTSQLRDPARVSRLLLAACLAYLWVVYLGVCAIRDDWLHQIHRPDRCDLSLFRLGLRLLARCLKDEIPIPAGFLVPAEVPPVQVHPVQQQARRPSRPSTWTGSRRWCASRSSGCARAPSWPRRST